MEYVLKLAEWIRKNLPDVVDDHLFDIEKAVRKKIEDFGLCLTSLMGDIHDHDEQVEHAVQVHDAARGVQDSDAKPQLGYSAQVKPCCMRCVKV